MLNVTDAFAWGRLAIRIDHKLNSTMVLDVLSDLFILRGAPGHVRSDSDPEFIFTPAQEWSAAVGSRNAYLELGSPWQNVRQLNLGAS